MSLRDIIDFSTFTDPSTASDLYSNSIRRAFSYDSYGNKTKFRAVVLTNPIPVSPSDLQYFTGTPESKTSKKFDRYVYRARILGANSPHEFLPNPCDATYAIDPDQALKVIEMHTLFISDVEFGTAESLPRINTVVEVELEKNTFGYNLQYGKHIKVSYNDDKPSTSTSVSCDSIKSIMDSATGIVTIGDNLTDRGVSYTQHFDENAQPILQPAQGRISSQFGNRIHPIRKTLQFHAGVDIANAQGTPILAALAGKVIKAKGGCKKGDGGCGDKGGGNEIKLEHSDGSTTRYLHLYELKVAKGDTVTKGQEIALMGTTGGSTGPHLHFEYKKGKLLNPEYHFEGNFEESKKKKAQEISTGKLQAEKSEVSEPLESEEATQES